MLRLIFKDLIERIKTKEELFTSADLAPIAHYDWYNAQYQDENLVQNHPFAMPAVFIEVDIAFSDAGQGVQNGDLKIKLHIVEEVYAAGFEGSHDQNQAFKITDYIDLINQCLHGSQGPYISGLRRVRLMPSSSFSHIYAAIVEYQGLVVDGSTYKLKNYTNSQGDHGINVTEKILRTHIPGTEPNSNYIVPL